MRIRPQPQKIIVAHGDKRSIRVERAIKSTIISHPSEHTARHTFGIEESGRVTEGQSLSTYPSDSATAANQRLKCAMNSSLEIEASRPADHRHFPPMDAPVVPIQLERLRSRCGRPSFSGKTRVPPSLRCAESVGDQPRHLVSSNEYDQCFSSQWRRHGRPRSCIWAADGTNDEELDLGGTISSLVVEGVTPSKCLPDIGG